MKGTFYGALVVFVAALLLVSLVALSYYNSDLQHAAAARAYSGELNDSLARFNNLGSNYRSMLTSYNVTISLLAQAVSNLNTSSPAYQNGVRQLAALWKSYVLFSKSYNGTLVTYSAKMKINYGNGTSVWYNNTSVQPGWNLFTTTLVLLDGRVQATWFPQFQEHLVSGVNGVVGNSTRGWFFWDRSGGSWQLSQSGADPLPVYNGTVFAWTYCGYDQNFNPTCKP